MRTILFWLVIGGAAAAQDLATAERAYSEKVIKARKDYQDKIKVAAEDYRKALELASKAAAVKGDLDKALVLRERAASAGMMVTPMLGKYRFDYANGTSADRIFNEAGVVSGGGDQDDSQVAWAWRGKESTGFLYWNGAIELIVVGKDGIGVLHYPKDSAIKGEAVKVK